MSTIMLVAGLADSLTNFRRDLMVAMITAGHKVVACAPEASDGVRASLAEIGVRFVPVNIHRTGVDPLRDADTLRQLFALFSEHRPDIVFSYTIKPVIYGSIAARAAGVPRVYSMITGLGYAFSGDTFKSRMVGGIAGLLYAGALRLNERVFFQNPDDQALFVSRRYVRNLAQTVIVNGSGVNTAHFAPEPYPSSISFLMICRLLKDKGVCEYAAAARSVRALHPGVCFRLAGWIDDNPAAIDEAELAGWQESGEIEFLGKLVDVRPAIADSSVYVLPSYREGTPRTVLEAMSMARPVITTDAPGCRETVLPGGNGYLVPIKNVEQLVEAMLRFIETPSLVKQLGDCSREIALGKYDVHKVNRKMLQTMGLV